MYKRKYEILKVELRENLNGKIFLNGKDCFRELI